MITVRSRTIHGIFLASSTPHRTSPLAMTACTMEHLHISQFLGILVVMLVAAKVSGYLAQRAGQPAVLGELIGGVLVGKSVLGLVNPELETIQLLSELGVVILLFAIGLETDLGRLLKVGATSLAVAVVGVGLPFALGFAACRLLGQSTIVSIVAAATLTATSVGITARVLSDLGRLHEPEGQIILGAAVIDDILGLLILGVVAELTEGREVSWLGIIQDDRERRRLSGGCTLGRNACRSDALPLGGAGSSFRARRRRWRSSPRSGWPGWPIGAARR